MRKNIFETNTAKFKLDSGANVLMPFSPPIYQVDVEDDLVNDLLERGDKLNIKEHDFREKLAGNMKTGCSYDYTEEDKKYFSKKLSHHVADFLNFMESLKGEQFMKRALTLPIQARSKQFKVDGIKNAYRLPLALDSLWINYQKAGDYNPPHTHFGLLSFVIFCKVPAKIFDKSYVKTNTNTPGQIIFSHGEDDKLFDLKGSEYSVKPYDNLMFIFPANLHHSVPPFWTDDTRVSVSGNYVFQANE